MGSFPPVVSPNSNMTNYQIRTGVSALLLCVLMAHTRGEVKRGCSQFGGSCFGAHGKRTIPENNVLLSPEVSDILLKPEVKKGCSQFGGSCFGAHGKRTIPEEPRELNPESKRGCSQFGGSCFGAHGKRTVTLDNVPAQRKRGCSQFGGSCFGAHGKRTVPYDNIQAQMKRGCSQFGGSCFGAHGKRSEGYYDLLRKLAPPPASLDETNDKDYLDAVSPY